jgi:hypothetical protein
MKDKRTLGIIILVAIVLFLIGFLFGVTNKSVNTAEQVTDSDKMLVVIEDHGLSGYYIVYDKDTKIIYYQGISHGACLDPLYNSDGTLKLYNGGN